MSDSAVDLRHDPVAAARAKRRVTLVSMVATGALAILKLTVGLMTGSLGVLSGAADSFMDLAATAVTFFAVRAAERPADAEHPYGHGKFETVAAFVECGFLMALAVWIALTAIQRLAGGTHDIDPSWLAIGSMLLSIVVDFWRSAALRRTAASTASQAIEADALNFTGDMLNSAVVVVGLGLVRLGLPAADAVAALIVAVVIGYSAWRLGRRTFDVLVDTAPAGLAERVAHAASQVPGVQAIEEVRVRPTGSTAVAAVVASVDRALPVERLGSIKTDIEEAVKPLAPGLEVTVTANPVQLDDESVATRLRVLAANRQLAIHHLTVQHIGPRLALSFDLEVDGDMPLGEAHALASRFENEVRADFGYDIEVDSHIEPLMPGSLDGHNASPETCAEIAVDLSRIAAEAGGQLSDIHNVRVRSNPQGLVVSFHARLAPNLSVQAAHAAMDRVERELCQLRPEVARIVGHAEPDRPRSRAEDGSIP